MGKDVLPNPNDLFQSLRYLQDQISMGRFKGHLAAYAVLLNLTMNMWTKVPNRENAGLGEVMQGRAAVRGIAERTGLDRRTVQRALRWLEEAGWIETARGFVASGREDVQYIIVRLDQLSHVARERAWQVTDAAERILREGGMVSPSQGGLTPPP